MHRHFGLVSDYLSANDVYFYNLICGAVDFHVQYVGHVIIVGVRLELYLE